MIRGRFSDKAKPLTVLIIFNCGSDLRMKRDIFFNFLEERLYSWSDRSVEFNGFKKLNYYILIVEIDKSKMSEQ